MFSSKAISSIRLLAMLMIIVCHIFQGENMVLAWWFNVGVQIFLFMSGFLYGTKNIEAPSVWLKRRFKRIALPYYIFVCCVFLFYLIFARKLLSIGGILVNLLFLSGFSTGMPGIEHLWFLSYILLCYLITPILQAADCSDYQNSGAKFFWKLFAVLAFLQILNYIGVLNLIVPDLAAYIIGYYFSRRYLYHASQAAGTNTKAKSMNNTCMGFFIACIVTTLLVLYLEYFYQKGSMDLLYAYKDALFAWNHTLLGISLFLAMYLLFSRLYGRKEVPALNRVINFSDKYSYHIYIVHQIVILGQFSCLKLTSSIVLNLAIIFAYSVFAGVLLKYADRKASAKFFKI